MPRKKPVRPTVWIGIDPGYHGALSRIFMGKVTSHHVPITSIRHNRRGRDKRGRKRYRYERLYDLAGMVALLRELRGDPRYECKAAIEMQRPRPTDSKWAATAVGRSQGLWEMACAAVGIKAVLVAPHVWKKEYVKKGADKQASVKVCKSLYPAMPFKLKKDEALAEATLIADHLRRKTLKRSFKDVRKR